MRLDLEWTRRVGNAERIILDEAQAWPEILARVRGAIDADRKRNGRFLLLGSVAPSLATHASESLAGRLSQIELAPLQWSEVPSTSRKHLWLRGGYPDGGILDVGTRLNHAFPQWQVDYLALLAQRDFPSWGLPAKPQVTDRLLTSERNETDVFEATIRPQSLSEFIAPVAPSITTKPPCSDGCECGWSATACGCDGVQQDQAVHDDLD